MKPSTVSSVPHVLRPWTLTLLAATLLVGIVAAFVFGTIGRGVPLLRHDWYWPTDASSAFGFWENYTSGWLRAGIGYPNTYPSGFFLATLQFGLMRFLGPYLTLALFLIFVCCFVVFSCGIIMGSSNRRANPIGFGGIVAFALLNPWTYSQVVAGHINMVLSIAALTALFFDDRNDTMSQVRRALYVFFAFQQTQFFIIAICYIFYRSARDREWRFAAATCCILALPAATGVLLNYHYIAGTPLTLTWQASQSVPLFSALSLRGYFTHYDRPFDGAGQIAMIAYALIAGLGFIAAVREHGRRPIIASIVLVSTCVFVSGTTGAIAPLYRFLMLRVAALGVYRELYDLVGVVAIAYVVLLVEANRVWRWTSWITLAPAVTMLLLWAVNPPFRYFVAPAQVPHVHVSGEPGERYALFPAFQPLSYDSMGSGLDYDAWIRTGGPTPLNSYLSSYPANVALADYQRRARTDALRALSVSTVVLRPYLRSDAERTEYGIRRSSQIRIANPAPELAIGAADPKISSVPHLGDNCIFFGDAHALNPDIGIVESVPPARTIADPSQGWVDTRLLMERNPELGQPFGGDFTTSSREAMPIPTLPFALVNVNGELLGGHAVLSRTTQGYMWVATHGERSVSCRGRCAVALYASRPFGSASCSVDVKRLSYTSIGPWIYIIRGALHGKQIYLNVAFSNNWIAFAGRHALAHYRVSSTFNGWRLINGLQRIIIINYAAALQALWEALGVAWFLVVVITLLRASFRRILGRS